MLGIVAALELTIILGLLAKVVEKAEEAKDWKGYATRLQRSLKQAEAKLADDNRLVNELMRRGRAEAERLENYFRRNS